MPGTTLLTVSSRVNNAAIRHETRNGRQVIVIPSATLPDNIVMNGILYPAEEIAKSFKGLDQTPAPLGHPKSGGRYVSALSPEGINAHWVGAHNENVRQVNGRVLLDKVVDVENAGRTPQGQKLLDAINAGDPIHTSTGIFMRKELTPNAEGHQAIARDMAFDHDAILLDEPGAATPNQGVGMMVNTAEHGECELITAQLEDWLEEELDHLGQRIVDTVEEQEKQAKWQQIREDVVNFVKERLQSLAPTGNSSTSISEEDSMALTDEQKKEVGDIVAEALTANSESLSTMIGDAVKDAVAPIQETVKTLQANIDEADKAERDEACKVIAEAGLLEESDMESMTTNALKTLAGKCKRGKAAPFAGGSLTTNSDEDDGFKDVDLNANIDEAQKAHGGE